jgi:predicted nuclease with TOPRIM domain
MFQKRQDEVRRARQNAELDSIVSQTVSAISPLSSGPSDDSEAMREEIRRLKLALAEKEAELQSKAESVDTASIVDGIKAEMTANFKDLEQRLFQLVDDKMNDVLRKSSQPSSQLVEEWLNNSPL